MKNKHRGLVCLQMANLNEIEYNQWRYRIKRAISSQIKNEKPELSNKDKHIILNILVGIDNYFSNEYINHINEILNMTLPTWTETEKYIKSKKIL